VSKYLLNILVGYAEAVQGGRQAAVEGMPAVPIVCKGLDISVVKFIFLPRSCEASIKARVSSRRFPQSGHAARCGPACPVV
jgi:hypothetical protein